MKAKRFKILKTVIVSLLLAVLLFALFIGISYRQMVVSASEDEVMVSSNGEYTVEIDNEYYGFYYFTISDFVIKNKNQEVVLSDGGICGANFYWSLTKNDLWVVSNDIGVLVYVCENGTFRKYNIIKNGEQYEITNSNVDFGTVYDLEEIPQKVIDYFERIG